MICPDLRILRPPLVYCIDGRRRNKTDAITEYSHQSELLATKPLRNMVDTSGVRRI